MATESKGAAMTRRERVRAALRGEPVDRAPISFWRHFPHKDLTARDLADSTLEAQRQFDLDLIKLMPTGMYSVVDYGVQVKVFTEDEIGATVYVSGPIREPADWTRLPAVSPDRGFLKVTMDAVRLLRPALPEVPMIQTIFSPLAMAAKIVGGDLTKAIAEDEPRLRAALEKVAEDIVAFGRACLEAGVDGFFFATQQANRDFKPKGIYEKLGVPYDLKVLQALREGAWINVLHIHGDDPLFELADRYPIDGVNWHDRETQPSLAQATKQTKRCMVAGIARFGAIHDGTPEEVQAEVKDAIFQAGGRRLIVAPGCAVRITARTENMLAARRAVEV